MKSLKILFIACLLLSSCFILYEVSNRFGKEYTKGYYNSSSPAQRYSTTGKLGLHDESSPARYYCNFGTEKEQDGEEGVAPTANSILKQVQVVFRHGDRSPMSNTLYKRLGITPEYCNLDKDRPNSHPLIGKFIKDIYNDYANLKSKGKRPIVYPYPNKRPCDLAHLSQFGVEQHLRNGLHLRDKYVEQLNFLSDELEDYNLSSVLSIVSTIRTRTLHSGIAFLYGLIPNFHLDRVAIKHSTSDLFRTSSKCNRAEVIEGNIRKLRYKIYSERQKSNSSFRKIADTFNINDHSGVLLDSFTNGFLCKNYDLPCKRDECVLLEDLDVVINEEEYLTQKLTEEAGFAEQSMLKIHPLLMKIVDAMSSKVQEEQDLKLILYSGHDTTLKPLISALGFSEFRWPRLASRMIFELWHDPTEKQHYVRLLFNGKDVTLNTTFCDHHGKQHATAPHLCDFNQFKNYITVDMLMNHFNAKTLKQACT